MYEILAVFILTPSLSSRSPVFRAMFVDERFAEARSSRVDVLDLKPENLEKLIKYMYTDQVKNILLSQCAFLTVRPVFPNLMGSTSY